MLTPASTVLSIRPAHGQKLDVAARMDCENGNDSDRSHPLIRLLITILLPLLNFAYVMQPCAPVDICACNGSIRLSCICGREVDRGQASNSAHYAQVLPAAVQPRWFATGPLALQNHYFLTKEKRQYHLITAGYGRLVTGAARIEMCQSSA